MSDYQINIKTVADLQAMEKYRASLVKLEAGWEKAGKNTLKLSDEISKLDDALNTEGALAVKRAKEWTDLGNQAEKAGNKIEAARLKANAGTVLSKAGLGPSALMTGAGAAPKDDKFLPDNILKYFVGGASVGAGALASRFLIRKTMDGIRQAASEDKDLSAQIDALDASFDGLFSSLVKVASSSGLVKDSFGILGTAADYWKSKMDGIAPAQTRMEKLTEDQKDAIDQLYMAQNKLARQEEARTKTTIELNKELQNRLNVLREVRKEEDSVADAKTGSALAAVDELERRGSLTKDQANAKRSAINKASGNSAFAASQAEKKGGMDLADKELSDLRKQKEHRERLLNDAEDVLRNIKPSSASIAEAAGQQALDEMAGSEYGGDTTSEAFKNRVRELSHGAERRLTSDAVSSQMGIVAKRRAELDEFNAKNADKFGELDRSRNSFSGQMESERQRKYYSDFGGNVGGMSTQSLLSAVNSAAGELEKLTPAFNRLSNAAETLSSQQQNRRGF